MKEKTPAAKTSSEEEATTKAAETSEQPNVLMSVKSVTSAVASDEPEVEQSDEVEFLRPLLIDDYAEDAKKKDAAQKNGSKDGGGCEDASSTWECGPAAYWYNFYDLENLILEEKKKIAEKEMAKMKSLKV